MSAKQLKKNKVAALRNMLTERGLDTGGTKPKLIARSAVQAPEAERQKPEGQGCCREVQGGGSQCGDCCSARAVFSLAANDAAIDGSQVARLAESPKHRSYGCGFSSTGSRTTTGPSARPSARPRYASASALCAGSGSRTCSRPRRGRYSASTSDRGRRRGRGVRRMLRRLRSW